MKKAFKIASCAAVLTAIPVLGYKSIKAFKNNKKTDELLNHRKDQANEQLSMKPEIIIDDECDLTSEEKVLRDVLEDEPKKIKSVFPMPTYVVNKNTKRYHKPDCRMLTVTDDVIHKTPEQLDADGYIACKVCFKDN